jgi:hypothetical protein
MSIASSFDNFPIGIENAVSDKFISETPLINNVSLKMAYSYLK